MKIPGSQATDLFDELPPLDHQSMRAMRPLASQVNAQLKRLRFDKGIPKIERDGMAKYLILDFMEKLGELQPPKEDGSKPVLEGLETFRQTGQYGSLFNPIDIARLRIVPKRRQVNPDNKTALLSLPISFELKYLDKIDKAAPPDWQGWGNAYKAKQTFATVRYANALKDITDILGDITDKYAKGSPEFTQHWETTKADVQHRINLAIEAFEDAIAKSDNPRALYSFEHAKVRAALEGLREASSVSEIETHYQTMRLDLVHICRFLPDKLMYAYCEDARRAAPKVPAASEAALKLGYEACWANAAGSALDFLSRYQGNLMNPKIVPIEPRIGKHVAALRDSGSQGKGRGPSE